jgi:hypothetical protein
MIKLKVILTEIDGDKLDEMAYILPKHSGLSHYKLRLGQHDQSRHFIPYIKVCDNFTGQHYGSLSIGDPYKIIDGNLKKIPAKDIQEIQDFILSNKEELLYYYNNCDDPTYKVDDLLNRLKKI